MSNTIIFASNNAGKLKEVKEILKNISLDNKPVKVLSMKEAGICMDIEENGSTFEENAIIKAKTVSDAAKAAGNPAIVIADDSGLEVDFMNKEPGIYSARWMGEDTSYHEKNLIILNRLAGVPMEKRTARYISVIACVFPDGRTMTEYGTVEGHIGYAETGENGFAYDPILVTKEYGRTFAELSLEEKNAISHRGKALRAMVEHFAKSGSESEVEAC